MTIRLLELPDGGASLEFSPDDWPVVRRRILERLGAYEATPWIDGAIIDIGGDRITLADDWDEPCLIGSSATAVSKLRRLADEDPMATRIAGLA